jgi:HD-like signal output (HDOD) protein
MQLPVVVFFVLLAAFIVIMAVSMAGQKRSSPSRSSKAKAAQKPEAKAKSATPPPTDEAEEEAPQPLATPSLVEVITYSAVPEGVGPAALGDVDEAVRTRIDKKISTIPPMPTSSHRLYEMLKNPFSNAKDISALVGTNPVLSGKILRTINSAYFGLAEKVTSVGRAIVLLGYNNIKSLVMQDTLSTALGPKGGEEEDATFHGLWIHSTVVSACAHYLSQNVFRQSGSDMATIGLFHDIGKYFFPLLDDGGGEGDGLPPIIEEEKRYGMSHALLGSLVTSNWNLAGDIVKSIEFHHHPIFLPPDSIPGPFLKPALIICLSDIICNVLGHGYGNGNGDVFPVRSEYFQKIKMAGGVETLITPALTREIDKARFVVESYING